jgi:hypothetical protein
MLSTPCAYQDSGSLTVAVAVQVAVNPRSVSILIFWTILPVVPSPTNFTGMK